MKIRGPGLEQQLMLFSYLVIRAELMHNAQTYMYATFLLAF